MAELVINSRCSGRLVFSVPDDGGYVTVTGLGRTDAKIGTSGFKGQFIKATPATLKATARKWWWRERYDCQRVARQLDA